VSKAICLAPKSRQKSEQEEWKNISTDWISQWMMMLFKHIFNPEPQHKLPDIFSLFRTLMEKEIAEQAISKELERRF